MIGLVPARVSIQVLDYEARSFSSKMILLSTWEVWDLFASGQVYRLMIEEDSYQTVDFRLGGFVSHHQSC